MYGQRVEHPEVGSIVWKCRNVPDKGGWKKVADPYLLVGYVYWGLGGSVPSLHFLCLDEDSGKVTEEYSIYTSEAEALGKPAQA